MAIPVTPAIPPALTTAQALALDLMADGFGDDDITMRTEIEPEDLYQLAAQHNVPAPHGTVEGVGCHQARDEPPCEQCGPFEGRFDAKARARQRVAEAERAYQQKQRRRGRRRGTPAPV